MRPRPMYAAPVGTLPDEWSRWQAPANITLSRNALIVGALLCWTGLLLH